jgi:hypothetical protein
MNVYRPALSQSELIISRFIDTRNSPSPKSARLPRCLLAGMDLGEGREGGRSPAPVMLYTSMDEALNTKGGPAIRQTH